MNTGKRSLKFSESQQLRHGVVQFARGRERHGRCKKMQQMDLTDLTLFSYKGWLIPDTVKILLPDGFTNCAMCFFLIPTATSAESWGILKVCLAILQSLARNVFLQSEESSFAKRGTHSTQ